LPAQYNLGNALYKNKLPDDAVAAYDAAIQLGKLPLDKAGAFYNKGVVLQNNKKLAECIDAYKDALRLNPADEDARLNLQKALLQQKQQQQQQQRKIKKKRSPRTIQKQNEKQKQDEKEKDERPKPQPSKMTKKEAEEKLKALLQQEKRLQDKLRKVNAASPSKPDKDW
jgi:tetratricopeptide (TPR) repeat protein